MWENVFPLQTPIEEFDFNRLAQYNYTGASIHNIALNAAFLAAKAGTGVRMELARLVTVNGLPVHLQGGGRIPKLPADLSLTNTSNPVQLGQEIAQAIYGRMKL